MRTPSHRLTRQEVERVAVECDAAARFVDTYPMQRLTPATEIGKLHLDDPTAALDWAT